MLPVAHPVLPGCRIRDVSEAAAPADLVQLDARMLHIMLLLRLASQHHDMLAASLKWVV